MVTPIHESNILKFLFIATLIGASVGSMAQPATNSVYVNFGRQFCDSSYWGSDITLFAAAQSSNPELLLQCNTSDTIGNVFSKFISYNAINNKLYLNDISDGYNSQIYILNVGIPSNVTCPNISSPNYTIDGVILSQFEFDPLGDLYALSDYDNSLGTANIGAYDDTTGLLQSGSLKTLYFPAGHFPSDVGNGDIAILPNGRMFCVFGADTSKLFEITNYEKTNSGDAIADFLGSPTNVCFALAYDNGFLIMGGTDFAGYCYAYTYDIHNDILSNEISTPLNSMPVDATSFSPSIGVSEKLISSVQVDATHYDLTYHIYLKNLGNARIGSAQVQHDLAAVFGSSNISNVTTSWVSNGPNLALNTAYDGLTDINLLSVGHALNNTPIGKTTSTLAVNVRVADAIPNLVYYISAIFTGKIGKDSTLLNLMDSSNDYSSLFSSWVDVVDPNRNNVADDPGEGIPTPWMIGMLMPIELSTFDVNSENEGALLNWSTLSEKDTRYFAIERSTDAAEFDSIGIVTGTGVTQAKHDYTFFDSHPPKSTLYYRLKEVKSEGAPGYSEIKVLEFETDVADVVANYSVFPNPASKYLVFESSETSEEDLQFAIYNLYGGNMYKTPIKGASLHEQITLPQLPDGSYIVTIKNPAYATRFFKITINN